MNSDIPFFSAHPLSTVPRRVTVRLSMNESYAPFQNFKEVDLILRETMLLNNPPQTMFLVGGKKIAVHKHLLIRHSPVFSRMLEGPMVADGTIISIEDAEPEDFELVMKGLYEGIGVISNNPIAQVAACFMIAHKYNIRSLEVGIHNAIIKGLSASNVMGTLSCSAVDLGLVPGITSKCWSIIERNTLQAIRSPTSLTLSWLNFNKLLMNNRLTISEFELAKYAVNWCKNQRDNHRTLIETLGIAVYQIRFPLLTRVEFGLICKLGILRRGEIEDLKANYRNNCTFKTSHRRNKCGCLLKKINCPLCSIKWTPERQQAAEKSSRMRLNVSIARDSNNNTKNVKSKPTSSTAITAHSSTTTVTPCECLKYLSCPNFPNGQTVKIMRLRRIGQFKPIN